MSKMSEVIHLPLAPASVELEHVIVDGSADRAVLATCSEPQRSAMIKAVNCHDDMLEALHQAREWLESWASAEGQLAAINAAIAKAEGGAS